MQEGKTPACNTVEYYVGVFVFVDHAEMDFTSPLEQQTAQSEANDQGRHILLFIYYLTLIYDLFLLFARCSAS